MELADEGERRRVLGHPEVVEKHGLELAALDELELTDLCPDALVEVIEATAEHCKPVAVGGEQAAPAGEVVDLMAVLEQSVQEAREGRGETSKAPGTVHTMPKVKAAAKKKASAKKPAAKKTPAKKPSRRRSA